MLPEYFIKMYPNSGRRPKLVLVTELYDGLSVVLHSERGASEFMEYVLEDLAPGGEVQVRSAVRKAHQRLGLTQ